MVLRDTLVQGQVAIEVSLKEYREWLQKFCVFKRLTSGPSDDFRIWAPNNPHIELGVRRTTRRDKGPDYQRLEKEIGKHL